MLPTFSRVKRSEACAVSSIHLQPKRERSVLNMTEGSQALGEVSTKVKRFKLDTSTSKPSVTGTGAPTSSASSAASASNSVYSHIEGIGNIQQLRGLRCARRRGLFRLIRKNFSDANLVKKYAEAISILTPIFVQETQKQLANSMSDEIAKGKEPQNKYAAEINRQKNRPTYLTPKRRRVEGDQEELPEEFEEDQAEEDITELTREDIIVTKQLEREVLAAIAAITAGVQQEEMIGKVFDLSQKK